MATVWHHIAIVAATVLVQSKSQATTTVTTTIATHVFLADANTYCPHGTRAILSAIDCWVAAETLELGWHQQPLYLESSGGPSGCIVLVDNNTLSPVMFNRNLVGNRSADARPLCENMSMPQRPSEFKSLGLHSKCTNTTPGLGPETVPLNWELQDIRYCQMECLKRASCYAVQFCKSCRWTYQICDSGQWLSRWVSKCMLWLQPVSSSNVELPSANGNHECAVAGCSAGMYRFSNEYDNVCLACPTGHFAADKFSSSCDACPLGKYTMAIASKACEPCGLGLFTRIAGSSQCEICPPGRFNNQHVLSESRCIACRAGSYMTEAGAVACISCTDGRFSNSEAATVCTSCPRGTYNNRLEQTSCDNCLKGRFGNVEGALACLSCAAGRFSRVETATACTICPKGTYNGRIEETFCASCIAGRFAHMEGALVCLQCAVGRFSFSEAAATCTNCPKGKYNSRLEQTSCSSCIAGRFGDTEGAPACISCTAGYFSNSEAVTCTVCPKGKYSGGLKQTACTSCIAGRYGNKEGDAQCISCEAGRYSISQEATACRKCPNGTYNSQLKQTSCISCQRGRYANIEGATYDVCEPCDIGFYAAIERSTECIRCGAGRSSMSLFSTMRQHELQSGDVDWIRVEGSTSESACGCDKEYRFELSECILCTNGMSCKGNGSVYIMEGYYADIDLSVFKCRGDKSRCVGGIPGNTCAFGRIGITCAECEDGKIIGDNGTCVTCSAGDYLASIVLVVASILFLVLVYVVHDTKSRTVQSHAMLSGEVLAGQFIALVQQVNVIGLLPLEWVNPFEMLMGYMNVMSLDVDLLGLACLVELFSRVWCCGSVSRFTTKLGIILVAIIVMCCIHVVFVMIRHRFQFKLRQPSLVCSVGVLCATFYISILVNVMTPFQCEPNPNDRWTVKMYPSILCWESEEHTKMIVVGSISLSLPLAFLANCIHTVWNFPAHVATGSVTIFKAYAFLFSRFRPDVYWFSLVISFRGVAVAAIPSISDIGIQIPLLQIIFTTVQGLIIHSAPYRLSLANAMECYLAVSLQIVMLLASTLVVFEDVNHARKQTSWICACVILLSLGIIPLLAGYRLRHLIIKKSHAYQFFLCHHKQGAGAFARLLKMHLEESPKVARSVFLDSDNLQNLDHLFDCVRKDVDTFTVIASRDIFTRAWCIGEMTTARLSKVSVALIELPDCPCRKGETWSSLCDDYFSNATDFACLTESGIDGPMISDTLDWIGELRAVIFPEELDITLMSTLTKHLIDWHTILTDTTITIPSSRPQFADSQVFVVVDNTNLEALATAHVLRKMLLPLCLEEQCQQFLPIVLHSSDELQKNLQVLICVCSNGCFDQLHMVKTLVEASVMEGGRLSGKGTATMDGNNSYGTSYAKKTTADGRKIVPVIIERDFRFPSHNSFKWPEEVYRITEDMFKSIAVIFMANMESAKVLRGAASEVFKCITGTRKVKFVQGNDITKALSFGQVLESLSPSKYRSALKEETPPVVPSIEMPIKPCNPHAILEHDRTRAPDESQFSSSSPTSLACVLGVKQDAPITKFLL